MATKLDIEYIELRNFLSYGDYTTRLDVANLGPVLILGEIESDEETISSNGAGKSSLLTAFIWCLFGRTITNPAPGDRVINWFIKKNCYVKIKTADGWEIIRTRNFDGHSELILRKDGDDETQSTNTNAQKKLVDLFGLDYEIFTSSVFCGQFGKSFLEMSPVKRKETIERLLGLDRLNKYADSAKAQYQQIEKKQELMRGKIELFKADMERQEGRLIGSTKSQNDFEDNRFSRIDQIKQKILKIENEFNALEVPDVGKLKSQWDLANAILKKLVSYQDKIRENKIKISSLASSIGLVDESLSSARMYEVPDLKDLEKAHENADLAVLKLQELSKDHLKVEGQLHVLERDVQSYGKLVWEWEERSNTNCESCDQVIGEDHVKHNIDRIKSDLNSILNDKKDLSIDQSKLTKTIDLLKTVKKPNMSLEEANRLDDLNKQIIKDVEATYRQTELAKKEKERLIQETEKLASAVSQVISKLEQMKPKVSMEEANKLKAKFDVLNQRHSDLQERTAEVSSEVNPYIEIINDLVEVVQGLKKESDTNDQEIKQLDILFKHYKYVYRSYSDRRKIKGWLLSELVPFLNDRIHYYLDMFEVDMSIKFNSTLGVETDKWDYEFCSGGERKRIDLAIMFGLYDLYMSIYGQQCNIMVLDEVDSRLDRHGVESFSEVVQDICTNDERPKPSTIFVISHKQELQSMFPSQVVIKKEGTFSNIDQTVFSTEQK